MEFIIPCLNSFLITAAITPLIIGLATFCNCLDVPGERKLHNTITPLWGGLGIFSGVIPFLLAENDNNTLTAYIVASFLLVGMGMTDDFKGLGCKIKFAVMAAATAIVIFGGEIVVRHIGSYGSIGQVELGRFSIPFTFFSIIGITNAINLLDGLNGLASGISLLSFLFMGIAALLSGNISLAIICFAFVGALGAFLLYNFPNAKIFMGDSGSLFLGFSLAITAVLLTQGATSSTNAMFPVLVLLIPIFDTLRVIFARLRKRRSPFQADNLHLHYLLLQKNLSSRTVTLLFWLLTALLGGVSLFLTNRSSLPYLFLMLCVDSILILLVAILTQQQRLAEKDRVELFPLTGLQGYFYHKLFFAHKVRVKSLKWIVGMVVILLPAQLFAKESMVLWQGRDNAKLSSWQGNNKALQAAERLERRANLPG